MNCPPRPRARRSACPAQCGLERIPTDATDRPHDQPAQRPKTQTRRRARRGKPSPFRSSPMDRMHPVRPELSLEGEKRSSRHLDAAWRQSGGGTGVASHRPPGELLEQLDDRARRLSVPIGMTVPQAWRSCSTRMTRRSSDSSSAPKTHASSGAEQPGGVPTHATTPSTSSPAIAWPAYWNVATAAAPRRPAGFLIHRRLRRHRHRPGTRADLRRPWPGAEAVRLSARRRSRD
jgi:hypothetical protein